MDKSLTTALTADGKISTWHTELVKKQKELRTLAIPITGIQLRNSRTGNQKPDCCKTDTGGRALCLPPPTVSAILSSGCNVQIIIYRMIIISNEPESVFAVL